MENYSDVSVLKEKLKQFFDYDDFRNEDQMRALTEILQGENDVYLNLNPGVGKSICFQLPVLLKKDSLAVVFVPTHNLGKCQVDFLKKRNIPAEYLCPRSRKALQETVFKDFENDKRNLRFLYASTDKRTADIVNNLITEWNKKDIVSLIVFDEAHQISRFGHDFSPNYRDLAKSCRRLFPKIRIFAVTGTATTEVKNDLYKELAMTNPREISSSNTMTKYLTVCFIDILTEPIENLKQFIVESIGPMEDRLSEISSKCGIIFCRKKQAAKIIAEQLCALDVPAVSYDGDLSLNDRESIYERWMTGSIAVIATTSKFFIGIHGPNVRFVVHWSMPMSLQQLYQDTGRTSQDKKKTSCRLYFSIEEEDNINQRIKSLRHYSPEDCEIGSRTRQFFDEVLNYCLDTRCRHVTQLDYFGKKMFPCRKFCDACLHAENLKNRIARFQLLRYMTAQKMLKNSMINRNKIPKTSSAERHHRKEESNQPIRDESGVSAKTRQQSYNRLHGELTNNYKKNKALLKGIMQLKDINHIARQLELSLSIGTNTRQKYNHDVNRTLSNIIKHTEMGKVCGYLKYHRGKDESTYVDEPEVINLDEEESDDETPSRKLNNKNTKSSGIVQIVIDDSDSGSETP